MQVNRVNQQTNFKGAYGKVLSQTPCKWVDLIVKEDVMPTDVDSAYRMTQEKRGLVLCAKGILKGLGLGDECGTIAILLTNRESRNYWGAAVRGKQIEFLSDLLGVRLGEDLNLHEAAKGDFSAY